MTVCWGWRFGWFGYAVQMKSAGLWLRVGVAVVGMLPGGTTAWAQAVGAAQPGGTPVQAEAPKAAQADATKTEAPKTRAAGPETLLDLKAKLTEEQQQKFDGAMQAFGAQKYSDALAVLKTLLAAQPEDRLLGKLASEAALNTGDAGFALATLKPIAAADETDWQAQAVLVRACAESGDAACRDAAMARMAELHGRGLTPEKLGQYLVERVKAGENTVTILHSLTPWGPYKVYDFAQVAGPDGKIFMRISVESNDAEQALFAQQHAKEAAAGMRSFTLDAYRETGLNASGQRTQTHYTFKFFAGEPAYQTVHDDFLGVVNGTVKPISSRTGLVVPN